EVGRGGAERVVVGGVGGHPRRVAQGHRGGRKGAADWEIAIGDNVNSPGNFGQAYRDPTSGEAVAFEVTYDPDTGDMSFTVGDKTASWTTASPVGLNTVKIWVQARVGGDNTAASVELTDLLLDGESLRDMSDDATSGDIDTLYALSPLLLGDGFTLTGTTTFTWDGSAVPKGSRMQFHVQMGTCTGPATQDTDGDGCADIDEAGLLGTDVLDPDTDGDLWSDCLEAKEGSSPTNPLSIPNPILGPITVTTATEGLELPVLDDLAPFDLLYSFP
ncbi:MAG: choice-of-anchor W domain-containing protein, partial [Thermoplasmatota archaeon]